MSKFPGRALFLSYCGAFFLFGMAMFFQTLGSSYKCWVDVLSLAGFAVFFIGGSVWVLSRGK